MDRKKIEYQLNRYMSGNGTLKQCTDAIISQVELSKPPARPIYTESSNRDSVHRYFARRSYWKKRSRW